MEIYVVFRNDYIPSDVHVLGDLGAWKWGKVKSYKKLRNMVDLHPVLIDKDTSDGLTLRDTTELPVDPSEPDGDMRALTTEEQAKKDKGLALIDKLDVRGNIRGNVGDENEVLADLTKMVAVMAEDLYQKGHLSESIRDVFVKYLDNYDIVGLPAKMKERFDKIATILSSNYFK